MTQYPKIHLTMDNSFATKRWTAPAEWARIIGDFGISCIEASADTEADPFYCGTEYLDGWMDEVLEAGQKHGVRIVNFHTGYTTYRTLGLAHPDVRVRLRVIEDWLQVVVRLAAKIHAGVGFCLHAFPESVLQDPGAYAEAKNRLYDTMAEVVRSAAEAGGVPMIVEQMYAPHLTPWTVDGAREHIAEVSRRSGFPAYVTIDTGHQTGQHLSLRPTREELERFLKGDGPVPYVGADSAYAILEETARGISSGAGNTAVLVEEEMDRYPHLFATTRDCDLYHWLEELGCYSPIVHLQQSNGESSDHLPFLTANNEVGIVHPLKVLRAIARSFERPASPDMPRRCEDVYLTFEIFPHTADHARDILPVLAESVKYWRQWVPKDGMSLDSLIY